MAKIVKSKKKKASKFNIFCVVFFTFAQRHVLTTRLFNANIKTSFETWRASAVFLCIWTCNVTFLS